MSTLQHEERDDQHVDAPAWDLAALAPLVPVARRRPITLAREGTDLPPAPYAAAELDLAGPDAEATTTLGVGGSALHARRAGGRTWLELEHEGTTTRHESRRHARSPRAEALALSLTGPLATAWSREGGRWSARAILRLDDPHLAAPDPTDPSWVSRLEATAEGGTALRTGAFGQLGLRDPRLVTRPDGTAYDDDGTLLLTATAAGPGGFDTGHTSVWALDPHTLALTRRGTLLFRRPDRSGVLGDHATHVVRDDDRWLVATSTWADFHPQHHPQVRMTLAVVDADVDLLHGTHVLDTMPLPTPTTGLTSVGTWDPHLARADDGSWMLAFVTASRFFTFHPALAVGPDPADPAGWELRASAAGRTACEGPTLVRTTDGWRVLASHGRDGKRDRVGRAATYPVLDLDLRETGTLAATYPTNLPWPTLADTDDGPLLIGFDASPAGGPLLGYGTHGDLVLQRPATSGS